MFAATYAFYDQVFASLLASNPNLQFLYTKGIMMDIYVYTYIMLLAMCLIVSLAMPLDRAKPCFMIATTIFGIMSITAITGMCFYLGEAGFEPHRS